MRTGKSFCLEILNEKYYRVHAKVKEKTPCHCHTVVQKTKEKAQPCKDPMTNQWRRRRRSAPFVWRICQRINQNLHAPYAVARECMTSVVTEYSIGQ